MVLLTQYSQCHEMLAIHIALCIIIVGNLVLINVLCIYSYSIEAGCLFNTVPTAFKMAQLFMHTVSSPNSKQSLIFCTLFFLPGKYFGQRTTVRLYYYLNFTG